MKSLTLLAALLSLALPAAAQVPGIIQGGGPGPDLATASVRVERSLALATDPAMRVLDDLAALRAVSAASAETVARADALLTEAVAARAAGRIGEMRAKVAEASALLRGKAWTGDAAAAASVAVEAEELIADPSRPLHFRLSRLFPAPDGGLTLRIGLSTLAAPTRGATPNGPENLVATLTSLPLDKAGAERRSVRLGRVADGAYALEARVYRGDMLVGYSRAPLRVVNGLAAAGREARTRLARLQLRYGTAAAISYPFDTAQAVNGWRRDIPDNLDFAAAIARSRAALSALEAGRDTVWQATGDQHRAYPFARGGETMPYRVYVPASWKPGMKLPLVVELHGGGGNEDSDFRPGRFGGLMQRLADKHGFIVVAPLGYRPSGGYGTVYGKTVPGRDSVRPGVAAGETVRTLSEADTMAAVARVAAEYGTDAKRTYLVGNSMGGGGVWYIGGRYAAMFAAIAPCGSSMPLDGYDFGQLHGMPVRIVVGALDAELRRGLAARAHTALKARGEAVTLTVVPNENHGDAWLTVLPETFDFFAAHRKAD